MKKAILLSTIFLSTGLLQSQSTWSLGASVASHGNYSYYNGGSANANARFHHNMHASGSIGFVARKALNDHWSFQTGLGFSSIGFDFAISQDYSLLNKTGQFVGNTVSTSTVIIPASIVYNSKLNCRNWRWFIGGGLSAVMSGKTVDTYKQTLMPDDNTSVILDQTYHSGAFTALNGHLIGGIEKVFKNNSILSWGLMFNGGMSVLATTTVNYTLDGISYTHKFTNRGSYGGMYVSYFFRPLGSKKAQK